MEGATERWRKDGGRDGEVVWMCVCVCADGGIRRQDDWLLGQRDTNRTEL